MSENDGRPPGVQRASRTDSHSVTDRGDITPSKPGVHATPAEREALAAEVCIVCGRAEGNLSSLARCLPCIRAASAAWEAKRAAALAASTPPGWAEFWASYKPPDDVPRYLALRDAERAFEAMRHAKSHPRRSNAATLTDPRRRLRGLVDTVLNTTEGQRNTVLHWAACRAGEMLAAGEVDQTVAVAILQEAGLAVGLTPREVGDAHRGTIASGLRTGSGGVA